MKNRETLSEFNKRRADKPTDRLTQLGGKPIDLEAMVERIVSKQTEQPTYACLKCWDTGFVITDRTGPKRVYGAKPGQITYSSRKCSCKSNTYKNLKPRGLEDLPI